MMQQPTYKKLEGSKPKPMKTRLRPISAVVFLAFAALVTSCSEPEENPIVGTWLTDSEDIQVYDLWYALKWQIESNKTYKLDFSSSDGDEVISGYSSGTYRILSDSILVVKSSKHENLEANELFRHTVDTLFIKVNGSELIASQARLIDSTKFVRFDIILTWERQ